MSNIAKGIYVFNLDGTPVGHFRTQLEAKISMGVPLRHPLTEYARKGGVLHGKWRVSFTSVPLPIPEKKSCAKKTFLYTREGGFVGEFKSRSEAIQANGGSSHPRKVLFLDSPAAPVFDPLKKTPYKDITLYSNQGNRPITFANTAAICKHFGISNQMVSFAIRSGARIRREWATFCDNEQTPIEQGGTVNIAVRGVAPMSFLVPVGHYFDYFFEAARFTGLHINRMKALANHNHFYMGRFKVEMDGDKIVVWVKSL